MTTRAKNNITKPKNILSLTALSQNKNTEPTTLAQALRDPNWRKAMSMEIDAQLREHTWDLVPPVPNRSVIDTKWIFTLKTLPDGSVDRFKARLVASGFNQQYGIDYMETFSPVIKSTTIRLVLDIAVKQPWSIRQLDINNAFLQGTLNDEVYVSQPPGSRAWYQELRTYLVTVGFKNSLADASLFVYHCGTSYVYLLVYVDDILITGKTELVNKFIHCLAARFSLKDQGEINYFLGIEATRTSTGLHLMQRKYIKDLLHKTNMLTAKPVTTPMSPMPKLTINSGTALDDASEYRRVLGSLQYLSLTRPDIGFAVNRLSQFMHRPTDVHWQAAKRILRYLAGTISHGILLKSHTTSTLHAFSDADWAGDTDDYVSTNAYIIYLGGNPISWSSKK